MRRPLVLFSLVLLLLTAACSSSESLDANRVDPEDPSPPTLDSDAPDDPSAVFSAVGTVRYVDLEGGFYGIVADDGTRYNPTNLDDRFKEDGMRVRFRAVVRNDVMTTQMWGTVIDIQNILPVTVDD